MFTGIIDNTGIIKEIARKKGVTTLTVKTELPLQKIPIGGSIAIDGTCFTIHYKKEKTFSVDVMEETLSRTISSSYDKKSSVNLELPLKLGDSLDGHIITGHIDYTAKILSIKHTKSALIIEVSLPKSFRKYVPEKGSITINGVSLTIAKVKSKSFYVHIIPHTQQKTNLTHLLKNSKVNVEIDTISRYLETLIKY